MNDFNFSTSSEEPQTQPTFKGFPKPKQNYSRLPHAFINRLSDFQSISELKVVLYILRHTWGFSEYDKPKQLTIDEFMFGRKRKDGARLDKGTGLSKPSVIRGLADAVTDGFLVVKIDDRDKGRIRKLYSIRLQGDHSVTPDVKEFDIDVKEVDTAQEKRGKEVLHRTEKATLESNLEEKDSSPLPYHIAHGFGLTGKEEQEAHVRAIKASAVWLAFRRGWDGIEPEVLATMASTTRAAVDAIQQDVNHGVYSLIDIEKLTREKLSSPKTANYRITFIKVDMPGYLAVQRAKAKPSDMPVNTEKRTPVEQTINSWRREDAD